MSRPLHSLLWMGIFTLLIIVGCIVLANPLYAAFASNIAFNSVILLVFLIGVIINFRQVVRLYPEIDWLERYQLGAISSQTTEPKLLSSMARLLEGKENIAMSTHSLQTILESIRTRLEDSRDLSRYIIGVLIFLGLLGTFWGLMSTVTSIGMLISEMSVDAVDGATIFASLKNSLAGPLSGMGVAFSSSLFGLAGSLVVGFLDLQSGHAQNRFVNELEEWLSSSTRISSGVLSDDSGAIGGSAYLQALLEKTADALDKMQRMNDSGDQGRNQLAKQLGDMRDSFGQFNHLLTEQNERLERAQHSQAEITRLLKSTLEQLEAKSNDDELRSELRLLTKTIANALSTRGNA